MSRTLPSDASSNFTGVSRTEATKQNDAGLVGVAAGYQAKSRMGDGCWNVRIDVDSPGFEANRHYPVSFLAGHN